MAEHDKPGSCGHSETCRCLLADWVPPSAALEQPRDAEAFRAVLKQQLPAWRVLRYTGSEIHANVAKCAAEIQRFVTGTL